MIRGEIKHPQVLAALAAAGHGAKIMVTDAHYPVSTAIHSNAVVVRLALAEGNPTVPFIVGKVMSAIPVEAVAIPHVPDELSPADVQVELAPLFADIPVHRVARPELYELGRSMDVALCLVSGDARRFGNVVLTVGVLLEIN